MRSPLRRTGVRAVAGAASALALSAGLTLVAAGAGGAWVDVPDNGAPGLLDLHAIPHPMHDMDLTPGAANAWQIRVSLTQDSAEATMYIARDGVLASRPDALQIVVATCDVEWNMEVQPATCPGSERRIAGPVPASDPSLGPMTPMLDAVETGTPLTLGTVSASTFIFVLVTVWVDDTPATRNDPTLMGQRADLGLAFTAQFAPAEPGTAVPPPTVTDLVPPASPPKTAPPSLASTGARGGALMLVAAGLLGLGATLRRRAHQPTVTAPTTPGARP